MKRLLVSLLIVLGFVSETAIAGWTVQNFDKANHVRPENALSKSAQIGMFDGDINTPGNTSNWYTHGLTFTTPKDITEVRVYPVGGTGVGYTRPNVADIRVKYWGADNVVSLSSTGYSFMDGDGLTSDCIQMVFTPADGFVAKRVSFIDVHFAGVGGDMKIGEIEFLGLDSFVPEIHASYLIGQGRLNTSVTVKAQAYPVQTYFCYGETDGGEVLNAWDHVVEAGSATALDTPFEEHRTVDFKYCRYYFCDPSFEVASEGVAWSETFVLNEEPSADLALITHGATALGYQVTPTFCGGTNDNVKISAAITPHGQTMSELSEVKSGVVVGEAVSVVFDGLQPMAEYDYQIRIENGDGDFTDLTGSTTTRNTTEWVKGTYSTSDWTLPANWISPCGGDFDVQHGHRDLFNAKVTSGSDERIGVKDGTCQAWFTEAKDIEKIIVYMSGDIKIQVVRVEVLYDGDEEFTVLPHSGVDYMEDGVNAARKLEFVKVDGGLVAENVKEVKVIFGDCNPAHVGCSEICFIGQPHAGKIRWSVGKETDSSYAPSSDELGGLTIADNYKAVLTDHDLTTSAFKVSDVWGGTTLVWEFEKAMDIRSVRLVSATVDVYHGFKAEGVYVKYKGDADYTYLEGSYLDKFNFGFGQSATFGTSSGKGYFARGVEALQVKVSPWDWRVNLAEVECCGRESSSKGMTILFF